MTMFLNRVSKVKLPKNARKIQSVINLQGENDIQSKNLEVFLAEKLKSKVDSKDLIFGKVMTDHMLQLEWSKGCGWSAPVIKPHEPLQIHPMAGVLQYEGQIYEGMKAFYGVDKKIRIFRPDENVARFNTSAQRMCLPVFNEGELLKCILELVKLEKDWVPKEEGCSLYVRPTLISLDVTEYTLSQLLRSEPVTLKKGLTIKMDLGTENRFAEWVLKMTRFGFPR